MEQAVIYKDILSGVKSTKVHLSQGFQHMEVAVDDDGDRYNETEEWVQNEVAGVAPRPLLPRQREGRLEAFETVGAPAE